MSVLENVAVAGMAAGRRRAATRTPPPSWSTGSGLGQWRDARSDGLPTAALKRLELARALARGPACCSSTRCSPGWSPPSGPR